MTHEQLKPPVAPHPAIFEASWVSPPLDEAIGDKKKSAGENRLINRRKGKCTDMDIVTEVPESAQSASGAVPIEVRFEFALSLLEERLHVILDQQSQIENLKRALHLVGAMLRPAGAIIQ